ncbi:hypothetical protein ABK040_002671 [Willaertia magna]
MSKKIVLNGGNRLMMSYTKLNTYLTCPQQFKLIYLDQNVESIPTVPMLRGSAYHEALANFANHYKKTFFTNNNNSNGIDTIEHQAIDWSSNIMDKAIKTFNFHLISSAKASKVFVERDILNEAKEIIQRHILRELSYVLCPPPNLVPLKIDPELMSEPPKVLKAIIEEQKTNKENIYLSMGKRFPIHIEKEETLKDIGGKPGIDLVVIFDRIDIEYDGDKEDKNVIVEYKTRVSPAYLHAFKLQLAIYHYAFKKLYGKPADRSYLTDITNGRIYCFDDSLFNPKEVEDLLVETAEKIQNDIEFKAEPTFIKCQNCTVKQYCKFKPTLKGKN